MALETKHRGSTAGLKPPWQPGESGNPAGRPKTSLTSILREALEQTDKDGKTTKERIIERLVKLADDPRGLPAIQEILDRIDGKVAQKTDLNIEGGEMIGAGVAVELFKMLQEQRRRVIAEERLQITQESNATE